MLAGYRSLMAIVHTVNLFVTYAKDYQVILFCIPPHTTHKSQSLDVSVFNCYNKIGRIVVISSFNGLVIIKYHFSGLLYQAWGKMMNSATICSGFRRSGIRPFNPDAITCSISVEIQMQVYKFLTKRIQVGIVWAAIKRLSPKSQVRKVRVPVKSHPLKIPQTCHVS